MSNEFVGCTVTINVCKTKCKKQFGGWGRCVSAAAVPPPQATPVDPVGPTKLNDANNKKKCCPCRCTFKKKTN